MLNFEEDYALGDAIGNSLVHCIACKTNPQSVFACKLAHTESQHKALANEIAVLKLVM